MFGSVKLTKNAGPDKYKYSSYSIGLDSRSEFSLTDGRMGRNVIIFRADMSSSVHVNNKNKDMPIIGDEPTQGLDDTTLTAEAIYPINFTQPNKRFVLSLHYNGSNSFLFVNATRIYQFRAKNSETKYDTLCLGNILKDFTINNMTVPYSEFFWTHQYMYRDQDFNESIGEHTIRQTNQQNLWLYLTAFRCRTTEQSYKVTL